MADIMNINEGARELERLLRLQSMPIALKMLKEGEGIPEEAVCPLRNLGHYLSFCQALALTRREGTHNRRDPGGHVVFRAGGRFGVRETAPTGEGKLWRRYDSGRADDPGRTKEVVRRT